MEHCRQCGKSGDAKTIRRCSGCKSIHYCSRDCQKRHWSVHKVMCSPSKTGKADAENDVKPTPTAKGQPESKPNPKPKPGSNLKYPGATFDPWKHALSRALKAFPGNRIIDLFAGFDRNSHTIIHTDGDLGQALGMLKPGQNLWPAIHPGCFMKSTGVVIVLQLLSQMMHPLPQRRWRVVDKEGRKAFMTLKTAESPAPYFRYDDLLRGRFLCLKNADVELDNCDDLDSHFITVNDASTVRIFAE